MRHIGLLLTLSLLILTPAWSQERPRVFVPSTSDTVPAEAAINQRVAVSPVQTAVLQGRSYPYRLVVNRTPISDRDNTFPPADIVAFSYEAETDTDKTERPVIFAFNGGPGSSSMWLHMGAWGPKRIAAPGSPDTFAPPPYPLEDNEAFLIDLADIVFIDPVSTGLSKPVEGESANAFYDTRTDARSMCTFIRNWMEAEGRTGAPIYIAGESYGAIRAAGIVSHGVCGDVRANIEGLVMVSGLLDMRNFLSNTASAQISRIPTRAALAWYHETVNRALWDHDFDAFLAEVRETAITRLGPAVLRGNAVSEEERLDVRRDVGRLIGITPDAVNDQPGLPLSVLYQQANEQYLGGQPQTQDGRYLARNAANDSTLPPLRARELSAVFRKHLVAHVKTLTGFDMRGKYLGMAADRNHRNWDHRFLKSQDFGRGTNMAELMARQRRIRLRDRPLVEASGEMPPLNVQRYGPPEYALLVASGLHDGNTPFHAMELALQQAGFSPDRYDVKLYEGGHMMWLDRTTGQELADDVRNFVRAREARRMAEEAELSVLTP